MDKATLIARYAEQDTDKIVLARLLDRMQMGKQRNIPTSTAFLSDREQVLAQQLLAAAGFQEAIFFGGCAGAERACCCYVPDYWEPEDYLPSEDGPICLIRASFRADDGLTHRDLLGSLMGAGIKRETVGDLYLSETSCDLLVLREIAPYLMQNLESAGRARLTLTQLPLDQIQRPAIRTELIRDTVPSLRLDTVVASGFRLSRSRAAALIESGKTSLNHLPCVKPDHTVAAGDTVTVLGFGKFDLATVGGETKKGRIWIELRRYL